MTIISVILTVCFTVLAIIHYNWAIGGLWGMDKALPTTLEGKRVFNPKKIDSLLVALGLTAFALFYLNVSGLIVLELPRWTSYFLWIIPSIFLLRAIGNFKYVGFFKTVKTTEFGKYDTELFSPFCLALAVLGFLAALLNTNLL